MVPNAAAREAKAACAGLQLASAAEPARCAPAAATCTLPVPAPDFTALRPRRQAGQAVATSAARSCCSTSGRRGAASARPRSRSSTRWPRTWRATTSSCVALASDRNWTDVLRRDRRVRSRRSTQACPSARGRRLAAGRARRLPPGAARTACRSRCCSIRPNGDDNIGKIAASWGIKAVPESALIDRQRQHPRVLRQQARLGVAGRRDLPALGDRRVAWRACS